MESNAEMLARLNRMLERSHPSEWTREAFPGDVAAIRWAVRRIAELEGALRGTDYGPMQHGLADLLERAAECHENMCWEWKCASTLAAPLRQEAANIRAALSPAPAKEGEAQGG